jgi:hypothetical protein
MVGKLRDSRSWQLLIGTTLVLIVPLMLDLQGRMKLLRSMRSEESRLIQELAALRTEHESLQTRLELVVSEGFLDRWARVDLRLNKPGEVTVVPMHVAHPPTTTTPLEEGGSSPATTPDNSERWYRLFFSDSLSQ